MNSYGRELKRRRDAASMTVRALGDLIERSGTFVTNFELGRASNPPEPEMMRRLAEALDWPVSEQLRAWGYAVDAAPVALVNPFPPEDIRWKLVEAMKQIPLDGPDHASLMGFFALQLRMYRDLITHGLTELEETIDLVHAPYLSDIDESTRGIG